MTGITIIAMAYKLYIQFVVTLGLTLPRHQAKHLPRSRLERY